MDNSRYMSNCFVYNDSELNINNIISDEKWNILRNCSLLENWTFRNGSLDYDDAQRFEKLDANVEFTYKEFYLNPPTASPTFAPTFTTTIGTSIWLG